jgi:hypothetical protein
MAITVRHPTPSQRGGAKHDSGGPDNHEISREINTETEETQTFIPTWAKDLDVSLFFCVGFAYVLALAVFIIVQLVALYAK